MWFDVPDWTAAHGVWCTTAITTTSTVSTRPPTCFDGLAHAVADEMCYKYDFSGCVWVVIRLKQLRS